MWKTSLLFSGFLRHNAARAPRLWLCFLGWCIGVVNSQAELERSTFAVALMSLEKSRGHKWKRNSQGLILLTNPPAFTEHAEACVGPTCTRCNCWFCMSCTKHDEIAECPPKVYVS
jgi:hypothetical protein